MGPNGTGQNAYGGMYGPASTRCASPTPSFLPFPVRRPQYFLTLLKTFKKAMLEEDERFKGLYIMLDRVDVHCIWVSQAVLDLLPPELPDIPGGDIVRDPPGMGVFCDNAMEYVMTFWPKPTADRKTAFLKSAMQSLHSVGLVGMHDAGVNPDELRLYRQLARTSSDDWWTLRVYAMIECRERNTFCPDEVSRYADDAGLLSIESVKLFAGTPPLYLDSFPFFPDSHFLMVISR